MIRPSSTFSSNLISSNFFCSAVNFSSILSNFRAKLLRFGNCATERRTNSDARTRTLVSLCSSSAQMTEKRNASSGVWVITPIKTINKSKLGND